MAMIPVIARGPHSRVCNDLALAAPPADIIPRSPHSPSALKNLGGVDYIVVADWLALGNAMAPTLPEGALAMFQSGAPIVDGELYVVLVGGDLYVRRVAVTGHGKYTVYAERASYPHWVLSPEDQGVAILGRVVYAATWTRK